MTTKKLTKGSPTDKNDGQRNSMGGQHAGNKAWSAKGEGSKKGSKKPSQKGAGSRKSGMAAKGY